MMNSPKILKVNVLKSKYIVVGTALLALLGCNLLCGCGGKSEGERASPGTPEERQRKDAEAQASESKDAGTKVSNPADHGNISGETGGGSGKN